jgi:hypothetical protein
MGGGETAQVLINGLSLTRSAIASVFSLCVGLFGTHCGFLSQESIALWTLRFPVCTLTRSIPCRFITAVLPTNHLFGHLRP